MLGKGRLDPVQTISLNISLFIEQELAKSMVSSVPELGYLLENDQRIHIPLREYTGKIDKIKLFPDPEYLGKRVLVNKGKEEIFNLLDSALKHGKDQSPESPNSNNQSSDPQATQDSPEKKVIGDILDGIFH